MKAFMVFDWDPMFFNFDPLWYVKEASHVTGLTEVLKVILGHFQSDRKVSISKVDKSDFLS